MTSKDELIAALRRSADAPPATPGVSFVDALEQRLSAIDDATVVPFARRARRVGVATVAAIAFTVAGAAAAAGIVATHPFSHDRPSSPSPSTELSTELETNTSAVVATTVSEPVTTTVALPRPSSGAATSVAPPSSTTPPAGTTVAPAPASTVPPAIVPPESTASPTTTEVHTPTSLALSCAPNGVTVECNWSAPPEGTVRMSVLRSEVGATTPGRVFFVDVGLTVWSDPMAEAGVSYVYLVHAFDGADHSLGHSNGVSIDCC